MSDLSHDFVHNVCIQRNIRGNSHRGCTLLYTFPVLPAGVRLLCSEIPIKVPIFLWKCEMWKGAIRVAIETGKHGE